MSDSLLLPPYSEVMNYEGHGNYAVKKYYQWPFSFFYKKKLKMILDLMDKNRAYVNVLDYGSGKAEIFRRALSFRARKVRCVDKYHGIDSKENYDLIICASVLEFVDLKTAVPLLKSHLIKQGSLIGASPMSNKWTNFYFKIIGDKNKRNTQKEILSEIQKHFLIVRKNEWFGLYFSFKAFPR